jgi:hypothetical protein
MKRRGGAVVTPFMKRRPAQALHSDVEADLVVAPVPGKIRDKRGNIGKVRFRLPISTSFTSNSSDDQERLRPAVRESNGSSILALNGSLASVHQHSDVSGSGFLGHCYPAELDSDSVVDLGSLVESASSSLTIATNMAIFNFPLGPLHLSPKSQAEGVMSPALASTIDSIFGDQFAISSSAIATEGDEKGPISRFSIESESPSTGTSLATEESTAETLPSYYTGSLFVHDAGATVEEECVDVGSS